MRIKFFLLKLLPLWLFITLFKTGAALHYTMLSTLGERVFPLWIVGALVGASSFLQFILDVPAGYLLDRFGYKRLLSFSTVSFIIAGGLFFFGLHPWTYVLSIVFAAGGWLFFSPGIDAYILSQAEKRFAGQLISIREVSQSLGVVLAMTVFSFVVQFPSHLIGLTLFVILSVALFAILKTPKEKTTVIKKKLGTHSYYIRRHFFHHTLGALRKLNPASTMLLLSNFSSATFYGIIWFVVPLLIVRLERNAPLEVGLAMFDGGVLILGFFIGMLTDGWNKKMLIFLGLLVFAITGFLLGFNFGILFIVLGFLATTGDEVSIISLWAWMNHLDKNHAEDGLVSGALCLAQDLGWATGPLIAGLLFNVIGPSFTIAVGAMFIFITWFISTLLLHRSGFGFIPHPLERRPPRKRHRS